MLDIVGFKFNIPDIEEREQHLSISYVKLLGRLCDAKYIYLTYIIIIIIKVNRCFTAMIQTILHFVVFAAKDISF